VKDIKPIIAKNITILRQNAKMTQSELAEKLNYSDKAISKWERGESIPDITVLKALADLFGVPLDYLVQENQQEPAVPESETVPVKRRNHKVITVLSILLVWLLATAAYVVIDMIYNKNQIHLLVFVYAVPVSVLVWLVLNSVWFGGKHNCAIVAVLMWTILISVVLALMLYGLWIWQPLLLGIPGQIIIAFWSKLQYREKK
jgi:transcriptional regulator with XRE-family HTH domain